MVPSEDLNVTDPATNVTNSIRDVENFVGLAFWTTLGPMLGLVLAIAIGLVISALKRRNVCNFFKPQWRNFKRCCCICPTPGKEEDRPGEDRPRDDLHREAARALSTQTEEHAGESHELAELSRVN